MSHSVPRRLSGLRLTASSSRVLVFAISAWARQPLCPIFRNSVGLRNEAASFALCYDPVPLLALLRQGVYDRASAAEDRSSAASVITIRATVHSRYRTFTGQTRSIMGCEQRTLRFAQRNAEVNSFAAFARTFAASALNRVVWVWIALRHCCFSCRHPTRKEMRAMSSRPKLRCKRSRISLRR